MGNVIQFKRSEGNKTVRSCTGLYENDLVLTSYENLFLLRQYYLYIKPETNKFLEVTNAISENLETGEMFPSVTIEIYGDYKEKVIPNYLQIKEVEQENWDAI